VRRPWVGSILECLPELVALLSGVVANQMPRVLLFEQVFEAAGFLELSFAGRCIAVTVLSVLRLRLGLE
jgi:hypothetical protein